MPTSDEKRAAIEQRVGKQGGRAAAYFKTVGRSSGSSNGPTPVVTLRLDDDLLAGCASYGNPRSLNLSDSIRELLSEALALHAEEATNE